ncbi:MAG: CotH kinase family protein [Clostridia bacterium]|nr:CotH kinase family protein [Clostridia bacterium]
MKRFALFFLLLALAACSAPSVPVVTQPPADMTTVPADMTAEETTLPAVTTISPETTAAPETTAEPETTATPETTAVPEPIADPFPMPALGDGVWYADSADALASIDFGDCASPVVCITASCTPDVPITFDRPITLYYAPDTVLTCTDGVTIRTRAEGSIRVITQCADLLSAGWLTVDAPFCTLSWEGELPALADAERYCNLLAFNGDRQYGTLGGRGDVSLSGVRMLRTATGGLYACTVTIRGNVITFGYPLIAPDADVNAATLYFDTTAAAPDRSYDLRRSHRVTLTDAAGQSRTYLLEPARLSYNLPVMQIYTEKGAPIETKTDYVPATLMLDGETYSMQIRGRGNASWTSFPKKSYRIKLDKGAPLFGLPENRDWVLTSNYADKSLIRNGVAHDIAAVLDGLDFTSTHFSVNLYLNGEYIGVYTFADKIEEGSGRLDFTAQAGDEPNTYGGMDIGFLCEVGWDYDAENDYNRDYFDAEKVVRIFVKEPKSDRANTPEFTYAKQYILSVERALAAGEGWQGLIDLDSWVDWFIVTELTFNTESAFYRSCYFWKRAGGKLMLGPVWDFDMAFGNHYGDIAGYNGWCTTESTYTYISENWMNDLIKTPEFTAALKARWAEVKETLRTTALASVDRREAELAGSAEQNFLRWNIMPYQIGAGSVNAAVYNTHAKQVQYLRDFIEQRWDYMDARIEAMS